MEGGLKGQEETGETSAEATGLPGERWDGSSQDGNQMVMRTEKTGSILKVEPRRAAFADGLDMEGERKGRDKDSHRVFFLPGK